MNVVNLPNNIHLLRFPDKRELCKSMLRFGEHYESPKFKGQIFTLKEFVSWYKTTSRAKGRFTYYKDWSGFNIPSYVFKPFLDGKFDPLIAREKAVLEIVKTLEEPYYLIACTNEEENSLTHELVHALFYTNKEYRNQVESIISRMGLSPFVPIFEDWGYSPEFYVDEINAYAAEDSNLLPVPESIRRQLIDLYNRNKCG